MTLLEPDGPRWRKSSRSGNASGNNCVEIRDLGAHVALRDSKDPQGPILTVGVDAWQAFLHVATERQG